MLKDSLFTIISLSQQNGSVITELRVNADNDIFKGHFPGQPVLPGACMLQMLKEVLEMALDIKLQLQKAAQMKFLSLIDPQIDHQLQLNVTYTTNDNGYNVTAALNANTKTCFKFKGMFVRI